MNQDPEDITLAGVGKISLNVGCKGYTSFLNVGCKGYTSFAFLQASATVKTKG
jgi:hypothetical protein